MTVQILEMQKKHTKEVIALLTMSLGHASTEKTIEYWNWKHIQNPFGKSKVLLGVDNSLITGVRAFMKWQWQKDQEIINTVRAVDTATLPTHQGKGIFKQLTLEAVSQCKIEGDAFVFNTPNAVSKKGYLKMGWSDEGRLPVYFGLGSIIPRLHSHGVINELLEKFSIESQLGKIKATWNFPSSKTYWHTAIEFNYLRWRYVDCPVVKYGAIIEPEKFGIIFRLKKMKAFIELRICEIWIMPGTDAQKDASEAIKKICKSVRPLFVSCTLSPLFSNDMKKSLALFGPFNKGPETTIRILSKHELSEFYQFKLWQPSLGSMELF